MRKSRTRVVGKVYSLKIGDFIDKRVRQRITTGDSRQKMRARGNKRRQRELDRVRLMMADRRSGAAQKRREKAFRKHDLPAMAKASETSAAKFRIRMANKVVRPLTWKERNLQERQREAARRLVDGF